MSRIYVNVGAAGTLQVPSTGANTQNYTKNKADVTLGLEAMLAVSITLMALFFLAGRFLKRQNTKMFFKKRKMAFGLMALALISGGVVFTALNYTEGSVQPAIAHGDENALNITTEDTNITINLEDGPVYAVAPNTVKVNASTNNGYTLSVYTENSKLVADNGGVIESVDDSSGLVVLGENTWGISLAEPEGHEAATWQALPASQDAALIIKNTANATAANDETTIYYGVHVTPDLPEGVYESGVINYVAVANAATHFTIVFDANGGVGAPENIVLEEGEQGVFIPAVEPELEHYVFMGWSLEPNDYRPVFHSGNWVLLGDEPTTLYLYAVWIEERFAILENGTAINNKLRSFTEVKAIRRADALPENFVGLASNTISFLGEPVYIFYDNTNNAGIVYYYTEADAVYMNVDSNSMFYNLYSLSDISGIAGWRAEIVEDMGWMFYATEISSLDVLSDWRTINLTSLEYTFVQTRLSNLVGLANWDVSNVSNMWGTFSNVTGLADLRAIANWDVSNVTDMSEMFVWNVALNDVSPLSNWNTSKVTNLQGMFFMVDNIDGTVLNNWDVSNVTDMSEVFSCSNVPNWYQP
ncbi:BspA family leucine-rich repeat surface protein [Candidatus Saccharibacteria bacterium]|nr:BspA family leucine-rich repeat surface protein [Candidatus Saccharibacteria bacterium]